jgi:voltage-gated potassium channel Kch
MAEIIINPKTKLIFAILFIVFLLGSGTLLFHQIEQWRYVDSFYFTTVTLTTIGYGDLVPHTDIGKLITSAFAVLGVGSFLFALTVIAQNYFDERLKKFNNHPLRKKTSNTLKKVANKSLYHVKKLKNSALKYNKQNLINQKEHKVFEKK